MYLWTTGLFSSRISIPAGAIEVWALIHFLLPSRISIPAGAIEVAFPTMNMRYVLTFQYPQVRLRFDFLPRQPVRLKYFNTRRCD